MTYTGLGLVLVRMAKYLNERLATNVIRNEASREVLYSIQFMLQEGVKICVELAKEERERDETYDRN